MDGQRNRPAIMTTEPSTPSESHPELVHGNEGANSDSAEPRPIEAHPAVETRHWPRRMDLVGYFLAAIFGGIIVAAGVSLISTEDNGWLGLTDTKARQQLEDLQHRYAELETAFRTRISTAPAGSFSSSAGGTEGLNEMRARLDGLARDAQGVSDKVRSLSESLRAAEQKFANVPSKDTIQAHIVNELAPFSKRLATIEREMEAIQRAENVRQAVARAAALTLSIDALKRAVSEGRPFATEMAAVENLSGSKLPVFEIAPYKDSGVATVSQLQHDFAVASRNALQSRYRNDSGSVMGSIISRAKAAIQIRPADGSGDTLEAILGRMDTALKGGNLGEAVKEGSALQGSAKQELEPWLRHAQERIVADEAIKKTDEDLLASLKATVARP
jgi:hypothetical protein